MTLHQPITSSLSTWSKADLAALFERPFQDLLFEAQSVHRAHFAANTVETAQLLSVKTGGCAEDCGYCSQSAHFETGLKASKLMAVDAVVEQARAAKAQGARRFCMGAAWRSLKDRDVPALEAMIGAVKAEGMETCLTAGMLEDGQAERLRAAGLDYYNHNLDTSPEHYEAVVSTRSYGDRLDTLSKARSAGLKLCCGGILGLGETREDRISLIHVLSGMDPAPESIPINELVPIPGTPMADNLKIDDFEFVRMIAVTRIACPTSIVRLSAGREQMSEALQALCFMAGANSIFIGAKLLTTGNPETDADHALLGKLGMRIEDPRLL